MATTARSLSLSDLPAEVTDVVRTFHPSTLWGRWEKVTHRSHVREDGHLEESNEKHVLWLRGDGAAQYVTSSSWKSFQGTTVASGEYGEGGSTTSIAKQRRDVDDAFLRDGREAAGTWEVIGAAAGAKVRATGDGFFSAGAFEDDDILYHGSGQKKGIEFEVPVEDLVAGAEWTHSFAVDAADAQAE